MLDTPCRGQPLYKVNMATVSLKCQFCGAEFIRPFKQRNGKYCSYSCATKARNKAQARIPGGVDKHPLYCTWAQMRQRCNCSANKDFHRYGGRGITVDSRWDDFLQFVADMGERPDGATLDRIKNSKGYSPENCRWATNAEQQNNKRANVRITYNGITCTMAEWDRRQGFRSGTLGDRITKHGWSIERALTTPVRRRSS